MIIFSGIMLSEGVVVHECVITLIYHLITLNVCNLKFMYGSDMVHTFSLLLFLRFLDSF